MVQPTCSGTTRTGAPCRAPATGGGAFCVAHDPGRVVQMEAWRRQGGRARSNRQRARRQYGEVLGSEEVLAVLSTTLRATLAGRVTPGQATALAAVARALVAVREASELEERLARLEEAARAGGPGRWTG